MTTVLILLVALPVLGVVLVICGAYLERIQKRVAESELEFWDANIIAAIHGGALT